MARRSAAVSGLLLAGVITLALGLLAPGSARATQRSCASYPAPGTRARAGAPLPGWLTRRYPVLAGTAHAIPNELAPTVSTQGLTASGLVLGHARLLARPRAATRIYLVPAEHLLAFSLAPARCLPAGEGSVQAQLLPELRRQYRHWALCVVVINAGVVSPSCGAASRRPGALLYASGLPGFGVVPAGIPAVTVSYLNAPPRTVAVHQDFYRVEAPHQSAAPCAAQLLDASGQVSATVAGCDYDQLLGAPLANYRAYVQAQLASLQSQVSVLAAAINGGDLAGARTAWMSAHATWLSIGQDDASYAAYGALGSALDGTSAGLAGGDADPDFTGFHRVELDLFTDANLTAAAADMPALESALSEIVQTPLSSAFPATANGIAAWVLRPHEILEDAIRDTLSGDDDDGADSICAALGADVSATRELLDVLGPVLDPLAPRLIPAAEAQLATLDGACQGATSPGGDATLSARQRQVIDAAAGAAAETLSAVPGLLTSIGSAAGTL